MHPHPALLLLLACAADKESALPLRPGWVAAGS